MPPEDADTVCFVNRGGNPVNGGGAGPLRSETRILVQMVAAECFLAIFGLLFGFLTGTPVLSAFRWDTSSVLLGLAGGLIPALILPMSNRATSGPFFELRELVLREVWPKLRGQSWLGLALLAASAGIGEEVLFRGFLQTWLAGWLGAVAAIVVTSLIFGLLHPLHPFYIVIASTIGFYLGGLYLITSNLVVPILSHAVYDLIAFGFCVYADRQWHRDRVAPTAAALTEPAMPTETKDHEGSYITGAKTHYKRIPSMKCAYVKEPGPASTIVVGDLPKPTVSDETVLVRVGAAAVNPIDTYVRAGAVKMPIPLPYIIGSDLAGTVAEVGSKVRRFKVGDRVWGSNQGLLGRQGVTAEFAAVDECWLYPTPASVADEEAAAVALVGITAHLGLFRDAQLKEGETLFVNGGAGGVGSTVVQMAKAVGARVIATVGSPENADRARRFGADVVLDYRADGLDEAIREHAPNGVNVWWETVREPNLERSVPLLAKKGRLVLMAGRDAKPILPLGAFYTKDCKILGFAMFNATPDEQRGCADDINRWLAEGKLRGNIGKVFPIDQAAEAHALQEENTLHKKGTLSGKIIIKP